MRIRETTSFPHPVLSPFTSDYKKGEFSLEMDDVQESPDDGEVVLQGRILLREPGLECQLQESKIQSGLMITCLDTYLDQWHPLEPGAFRLVLGKGAVRGVVHLQALLVATSDISLPGNGLVDGFTSYSREVSAGSPVALSLEHQLEVGQEKLAKMESIFSLSPDESMDTHMFEVDTDCEAIHIRAGASLFGDIQNLRKTTSRNVLLSALYLPVLMEVLDVMRSGEFAERRWHQVLRAKCNATGIVVEQNTDNLAGIAQQLLNSPLGLLLEAVEDAK